MDMNTRHLISEAAGTFVCAPKKMLIGAEWVDAAGGAKLDVRNPANGEVIAQVPAGDAADVDRAVRAARAAFETGPWPATSPSQRERLLQALADKLEANAQQLAEIESSTTASRSWRATSTCRCAVELSATWRAGRRRSKARRSTSRSALSAGGGQRITRREPVGVVGQIIPWNFPLRDGRVEARARRSPPAAPVVLKPAEQTPLTALRLGELIVEAGFPPGVVNIVTGFGETAGAALVKHPGVDKIAFTGSTAVGKLISKRGHRHDEARLARARRQVAGDRAATTPTANVADRRRARAQSSSTRAGLHRGLAPVRAEEDLRPGRRRPRQRRPGDEARTGSRPGHAARPARVAEQRDRVLRLHRGRRRARAPRSSRAAKRRPRRLLREADGAGGRAPGHARRAGRNLRARVVAQCRTTISTKWRALANDTQYGLGASIWSNDLARVHRLIPRIKAGTVWVNCHSLVDASLPFGGFKQSGIGREMGRAALDLFTETKSVMMAV